MRTMVKSLLAFAGMSMFGFPMSAGTAAESIENGVGILCESPQQVEELIMLRTDSQSAVAQVNAESNARVCEILNVAFLVGGVVAQSSNDKGTWEIRKILVVGLIVGRTVSPVQPYQKYTAFIIAKASPI